MKILVAMSGGVDSSVTAALLKERGYEVLGVTFRLLTFDETSEKESSSDAIEQAVDVANCLGIQHQVMDIGREFEKEVLTHCWDEYSSGRTPNPCVLCNPRVKFRVLFELADQLGIEQVATGHHARIENLKDESCYVLLRGRDGKKDQSYFLSRLTQKQLSNIRLVVGELNKSKVRDIARGMNLPNVDRPESQDNCFAAGRKPFAEALRLRFGKSAIYGSIIDTQGKVIGKHSGIHHFTVGQRKGLRIALGGRAWVQSVDPESGSVVVTQNDSDLCTQQCRVSDVLFNPYWNTSMIGRAQVQVRYRHRPAPANYEFIEAGRISIVFDEPQRAVTPGQAAVLYQGDQVIGSGWIEKSL